MSFNHQNQSACDTKQGKKVSYKLLYSFHQLFHPRRLHGWWLSLCLLLTLGMPMQLWAQTTPSVVKTLGEGNFFAVELTKEVFCSKDAAIRIVPKKDVTHLTNVNYTLEENFGSHFKNRSNTPEFNALSADNYTILIAAVNTTTGLPFEERINFVVPTPPPTPERDYAVNDYYTRVSVIDVATGKDLSTGKIALKLEGGKGLATTTISVQSYTPMAGYTPLYPPTLNVPINFTPTAEANVVMLDGEYPAGDYVLNIFDGCLGVPLRLKFDGKELRVLCPPSSELDFCAPKMSIDYNSSWIRSSFLYFESQKLELSFAPIGKPFTQWHPQTVYSRKYPITTAEAEAIDAAGGYQIALRYADRPEYVCLVGQKAYSSNLVLKRIEWAPNYISHRNCMTWSGWCPWFIVEGALCNAEIVVTKKATGEVVRSFDNLKPGATTEWPYSIDLVATAKANGKVIGSKEFRVDQEPPYIGFRPNLDVYQSKCIDVTIFSGNLGSDCLPVLQIKDHDGNVVYKERMARIEVNVPCLNYGEEYTADFFENMTSTQPIAVPQKFIRTLPTKLFMYGYEIEICNHVMRPWIDWEKGYYDGRTKKWPVGSVWRFEAVDVDASALPYTHIYQFSPDGYFYLPKGSYPPGKYKVTIDMDPTSTTDTPLVYYFDFAGGFQRKDPLRIDVSNECTNFAITPRDGTYTEPVYPGYSDNNAKQVYLERQQLDGGWIPVANLERDQPYYTTQTGHYRAFVDLCRDNIVEFDLSVPNPKLKNNSTLAYYCGKAAETSPNTAGTILIEAYDGTPPYSYHLYEMDASKPNKLGTLVSSYTNKPLGEQVAFSNLGVKAYIVKIEDACQQYFFYKDVMRPLKDVARAFVKKAVVCQGEPIELFTYNIKDVDFHWTKVGDPSFTHPEQNQRTLVIPHAQQSDAGTYQLTVIDNNCDNGKPFTSTVQVQVLPQFSAAQLNAQQQEVCWQEPISFQVAQFVDGQAPYTYQWEWSKDNGATWQTIVGQTNQRLSFVPPAVPDLMQVWVRCQVTDSCGFVVTTNQAHAIIHPCYAPVNPQLMNRAF